MGELQGKGTDRSFYATKGRVKQFVKRQNRSTAVNCGEAKIVGSAAFFVGQLGQHLVNNMQKITPIFLHFPALAQNSN
jgi:hypothetical protein